MTYNTLYEKFVDQSQNKIQGYIAYALYKSAKREWVTSFKQANGRNPRPAELNQYVSSVTEQTVGAYEGQAASILAEFADGAIAEAKPAIVEDALRGSFWGSVWQSIAANAIYTAFLILVVIILAFAGVDILGIVEKIRAASSR